MLFYLKQIFLLMAGLSVVGYFRAEIGNRSNTMLLNISDKSKHWLAEDTVIARISLLFLPLLILYNFLAWSVFGLQSIFEFVLAGLKWIWWLITWIWNEVLQPTLFSFFRLIWHYIVVMSWRLFQFGFSPIRRSVATDNLIYSGQRLVVLLLLLGGLSVIVLLTSVKFLTIPAALISFFLIQNTQFRILQHLEPSRFPEPNVNTARQLTAIWLGLAIVGACLLSLIIYFNRSAIVQGLGVSVTQVGVVLSILALSAFASATNCLPPHLEESGGIASHINYLKALLWRLPKLVYGQIFALPGILVVSLIPLIIFFIMNLAIERVTGREVYGWLMEIADIQNIPTIIKNDLDNIKNLEEEVVKLGREKSAAVNMHQKEIADAKNRLDIHERLLSAIKDRQIHTMVEGPITGDEQFFSITPVQNTAIYDWKIQDSDGRIVADFSVRAGEGESSLIEYRWVKEGDYSVTVVPRNSCGKCEGFTRQVTVAKAEAPSYFNIQAPEGKNMVCSGEEVNYVTRAGYINYEWQIPDDATILSDPSQNKILVKFGNQSGTIRVRATDDLGRNSLWVGVDVKVIPSPDLAESSGRFVEDELADEQERPRAFVFRTREEGRATVARMKQELAARKAEMEAALKAFDEKIDQTKKSIVDMKQDIWLMIFKFFGALLAVAGLALLAGLIFASPMLYYLQYQFDLYGFAQQGRHYWEELLAGIRARNADQPLLGIFVLLVIYGAFKLMTLLAPDIPDLSVFIQEQVAE